MTRRKARLNVSAFVWDTCIEIVANRWFDVVALYKLNMEGK